MEYIFSHTLFQSTLYIGIGKDSVGDFRCRIRKSGYALGLAVLVQKGEDFALAAGFFIADKFNLALLSGLIRLS